MDKKKKKTKADNLKEGFSKGLGKPGKPKSFMDLVGAITGGAGRAVDTVKDAFSGETIRETYERKKTSGDTAEDKKKKKEHYERLKQRLSGK